MAVYSRCGLGTRNRMSFRSLMLVQVEYANKAVENSGYDDDVF